MFKSFSDIITKAVAEQWAKRGPLFKVAIITAVLFILFSAIRFGYMGPEAQRLSRIIVPLEIPVLDSSTRPGQLFVRSEIANLSSDWTELISGDSCPSGSRIRLRMETSEPGWVAPFGLSAAGIYPILESGLKPMPVGAGDQIFGRIELDTETGTEVFGVLFSNRPIDFEFVDGLRYEHSEAVASVASGRGGSATSVFKPLPDGMVGQTIYCRHID